MPMIMGKRRRFTKVRKMGNKSVAKIARRVAKRVVNSAAEHKFFDSLQAAVALTTAGAVVSLSNIPSQEGAVDQGSSRDGDVVKATSLAMDFTLTSGGATTELDRIIVGIDKQSNGALPAVTDVLEAASPISHYNLANRKRFKILFDRTMTLDVKAAGATQPNFRHWKIKRSLKGRKLVWSGDATDEATTNNLFILQLTDDVTNGAAVLDVNTRLRYIDM